MRQKTARKNNLTTNYCLRWVIPGSRLFLEFPVALTLKGMTRNTIATRQSGPSAVMVLDRAQRLLAPGFWILAPLSSASPPPTH